MRKHLSIRMKFYSPDNLEMHSLIAKSPECCNRTQTPPEKLHHWTVTSFLKIKFY